MLNKIILYSRTDCRLIVSGSSHPSYLCSGLLYPVFGQDFPELCQVCDMLRGWRECYPKFDTSIMGLPITGQHYNLVSLAFYVGKPRNNMNKYSDV